MFWEGFRLLPKYFRICIITVRLYAPMSRYLVLPSLALSLPYLIQSICELSITRLPE